MGKFEQGWQEVFEGTEFSPSDSVWINIDRDLANAEGEKMKKGIVLYQRIAAASVLFALLIGSLGIYRWSENSNQVAQNKTLENTLHFGGDEKKTIEKKNHQSSLALPDNKDELSAANRRAKSSNEIVSLKSNSNLNLKTPKINFGNPGPTKSKSGLNEKSTQQSLNEPIGFVNETVDNRKKINSSVEKKNSKIVFGELGDLELLPIPQIHEGPVMVEIMRKLPAIPGVFMTHNEKKTAHEQVWASITAASGSYNPNTNTNSYNSSAVSQLNPGSNSSPVIGSSYSFGMLAGMRVAKRVVLQSGIQYLNQSINSTSNISSLNSLAPVASSLNNATSNYATTSSYAISSANEFVSVPVQAGYLFIDRKMGLQLNTGVSTEFFIRNTLSDPSGQRQSYSQSAGQDSPYRSVNFSGLLSSEVSYKLTNRYRVSVVPGLHYSFNPVLKSASNSSGNPVVVDLGFRFRYIFR